MATFGEGFFHRAVCSVAISYDGRFICGIGSDDHHAMGIWDVSVDSGVFRLDFLFFCC